MYEMNLLIIYDNIENGTSIHTFPNYVSLNKMPSGLIGIHGVLILQMLVLVLIDGIKIIIIIMHAYHFHKTK